MLTATPTAGTGVCSACPHVLMKPWCTANVSNWAELGCSQGRGTTGLGGTCVGQQAAFGRHRGSLERLGPDAGELTPYAKAVRAASTPAYSPHEYHALLVSAGLGARQLAICNIPPAAHLRVA